MMDKSKCMKILDSNLSYYGISLRKIMGNAGREIAKVIEKKYGVNKNIFIFCGTGNNGGDGLAAALHLSKRNSVKLFLLGLPQDIKTEESKYYWHKCKDITKIKKYFVLSDNVSRVKKLISDLKKTDIIIDAIVGLGISGKLREPVESVVKLLNSVKCKKVSVDLPTPGFKPSLVISLHIKKHPKSIVVDIGIPEELNFYTGPGNVKFLHKRKPDSHKGENGRTLVVAGSEKYHGAAFFSALAASKIVDLVYLATTKSNILIAKAYSPEFIVMSLEESLKQIKKVDSCIIGPGIEISKENKRIIEKLIKNKSKKFVLDASALSIIKPTILHKNCCITPHSKEFKHLFGLEAKEENVKKVAKKFNCIVVLKGKVDLISNGKHVWKNFSGNAGMTTGGTGDVLAGLIGGFAAKNSLLESALAGTFLIGFAADMLEKIQGFMYNASDVLEVLPLAKKICEDVY